MSVFLHMINKYLLVTKQCPCCNKNFSTRLKSKKEKKYCSHKCANIILGHNRSDEAKRKATEGYLNWLRKHKPSSLQKNCAYCHNTFESKKKKKTYCSQSCATKHSWANPHYREKIILKAKENYRTGRTKGWTTRRLQPSYAEKFWLEVLTSNSILYERELKVDKFFIDFALMEEKIALEIDGKQHKYRERQLSDSVKDSLLSKNGWTVYRIPWREINSEEGKSYIKKEIDAFLEFYRERKKLLDCNTLH